VPIVVSLTDAEIPETERRLSLFSGNLFVYSPRPSTRALGSAARDALARFFGPGPVVAQQRMSEGEFAALFRQAAHELASVAPKLASAILEDFGCDPHTTFVRAPTLSASTGDGFLAHGLGIPRHPHRDTWYAAAPCQLNWWIPLFDLGASASLAFHPLYWDLPVRNNSTDFQPDGRAAFHDVAPVLDTDQWLTQPRPTAPIVLASGIRIGSGSDSVILSSAAQLYSTVPDDSAKTHFLVHFQTVSERDLVSGAGASNLDALPHGTSLSSFVRCSDMSSVPQELIDRELSRRRAELIGRTS
jgi:hypothetical protein